MIESVRGELLLAEALIIAECWAVEYVGNLTLEVEDLVTSGGTPHLARERRNIVMNWNF